MNDEYRDDYLWDQSGEPDPEIERLEQTLSRLRYKRPERVPPMPLDFIAYQTRRTRSPYFAIAAAALLAVLAIGLWFAWQRGQGTDSKLQPVAIANSTNLQHPGIIDKASSPEQHETQNNPSPQTARSSNNEIPRSQAPLNQIAMRQRDARALSAQQRASMNRRAEQLEGEQAKERLMMALQIASDKLSFAQKKIQANKSGGPAS